MTLVDVRGNPLSTVIGRETRRSQALVPGGELTEILLEATQQVEDELSLEDVGWLTYGVGTSNIIPAAQRINNVQLSRLYYARDPLAKQAIRLWTDYTFGKGMTWSTEEDSVQKLLQPFWKARENKSVLSARGQRLSSNKLLVDGEIFFAIFLGKGSEARIRRIDPLEITEIITNPEDAEDVRFYKREWYRPDGKRETTIYRSITNVKGEAAATATGIITQHTDEALVYHLAYNTISQRGNPLLLPALDWIKQYRRFLAARVAIMLSLARFAWRSKVKGGSTAVNTARGQFHDEEVEAGAWLFENEGVDTKPIKTETGARAAYDDARLIKLQIAAAVGIPEQYFGDISIGNLATAKTVELPMMKMFQSYQGVWGDGYADINEVVLDRAKIPQDKQYVDMEWPPIAPADVIAVAEALVAIIGVLPQFADSPDVQVIAMQALGVNDPAQALEQIAQEARENPEAALAKALRRFKEVIERSEK